MEKQSVEEMFDSLWFSYPTDLSKNKRGGKPNALKAFKKINPDQQEFYRMMENMKAQIRHDRKDKDSYRWPFISTYLNQARYDDVIESEAVRIEREELSICCIENCNDEVHGKSFKYCSSHIPNAHSDLLSQAWKATGLKYGSPDFINECRMACKQGMARITSKMDTIK